METEIAWYLFCHCIFLNIGLILRTWSNNRLEDTLHEAMIVWISADIFLVATGKEPIVVALVRFFIGG